MVLPCCPVIIKIHPMKQRHRADRRTLPDWERTIMQTFKHEICAIIFHHHNLTHNIGSAILQRWMIQIEYLYCVLGFLHAQSIQPSSWYHLTISHILKEVMRIFIHRIYYPRIFLSSFYSIITILVVSSKMRTMLINNQIIPIENIIRGSSCFIALKSPLIFVSKHRLVRQR